MRKIIFDCERMKYANTGLFSYCLQLGMRLKRQAISTGAEEINFFIPPQVNGIFGDKERYIIQNSLQKFWLPSLKDYDIWHSTYQSSNYLPVLDKKIKVILTIHDLNFFIRFKKPDDRKKSILNTFKKILIAAVPLYAFQIFVKNDVLKNCDVKNKPVVVIHNGTNSLDEPLLLGNSYKPTSRFLFSIGVMNRKKNFHVLLPLLQHNNDMELLIAGPPDDPDYLHYIRDSAKKLGVEEQLKVLGPISEREKSWYYQNCYAFTFPSLSEGFGLPVAEAMSVGKPLFLSDKTALPEIGQDVAFYFSDFNEHRMQHVFIRGMEDYKDFGMEERIKQRGTDFCWQKAAAQYLNLYRSL